MGRHQPHPFTSPLGHALHHGFTVCCFTPFSYAAIKRGPNLIPLGPEISNRAVSHEKSLSYEALRTKKYACHSVNIRSGLRRRQSRRHISQKPRASSRSTALRAIQARHWHRRNRIQPGTVRYIGITHVQQFPISQVTRCTGRGRITNTCQGGGEQYILLNSRV